MTHQIYQGKSFPLGATPIDGGTNFVLFSKNCEAVELLLFKNAESPEPYQTIRLDPTVNRTYYYWHIFVEGVGHGQVYAYRVHGKFKPDEGHWFDGNKVLLDPYSKSIANFRKYNRKAAALPGDNCAKALRSVVIDSSLYDWKGDAPLRHPHSRTVIYEMHVAGFTKHPNSGVEATKRGTFLGLIEKIPYLKELGITAVELMPVQFFDPYEVGNGLINYWGYSTLGFFAPYCGYATDPSNPIKAVDEFRDMVRALHAAGIEVILDVVFNHTAEGDKTGPTICYRGIENVAYYTLRDRHHYADYSGCGNTVNTNHSIVRRMIMDCLRYWVAEMHVDGFRFDLASVLARDEKGHPLENPPVLWEIESDPVLSGSKIIAEAWDAGGLYQVGSFVGDKWAEWNGRFRDDVRCFVKGDMDKIGLFASSLTGSMELFRNKHRDPNRSINFVTCHDGFTLNDLVSYNYKHNLANGENNRDGANDNYSWNGGVEGRTTDSQIEALRLRQIKNFFAILMLSQGTPMILMGDEIRRTQNGNNNAYCQDVEWNWFNWDDTVRHADLLNFVKKLIRFNLQYEVFQDQKYWAIGWNSHQPKVSWHGIKPNQPNWAGNSHSIAAMITSPEHKEQGYLIINSYWDALTFELPAPAPFFTNARWCRVIDTAKPSPDDFCEVKDAPVVGKKYEVAPRSVVLLVVKQ